MALNSNTLNQMAFPKNIKQRRNSRANATCQSFRDSVDDCPVTMIPCIFETTIQHFSFDLFKLSYQTNLHTKNSNSKSIDFKEATIIKIKNKNNNLSFRNDIAIVSITVKKLNSMKFVDNILFNIINFIIMTEYC